MKLTKSRLQKIINNKLGKQTKKKFKNIKVLNHNNTARKRKQFNLHNRTIKNVISLSSKI